MPGLHEYKQLIPQVHIVSDNERRITIDLFFILMHFLRKNVIFNSGPRSTDFLFKYQKLKLYVLISSINFQI